MKTDLHPGLSALPPVPHKIVVLRGRNKSTDLIAVARLWLSDVYVRAGMGDVTGKALDVMGIERPDVWDVRRYVRLERYVADLLKAVPAYLYGLMEAQS